MLIKETHEDVKLCFMECKKLKYDCIEFIMVDTNETHNELLKAFDNIKDIKKMRLAKKNIEVIDLWFDGKCAIDVIVTEDEIRHHLVERKILKNEIIECTTKFYYFGSGLNIDCSEFICGCEYVFDKFMKKRI